MEKLDGYFSQILCVSAEKSRTRMKIAAFEPRENVMPPMPDFFFGPFFLVCFLAARKVFLSWAWGKTPYLFPSKNICDRCDSGSLGQPLSPFPPIFSTPGGRHPNLPGRSSHFMFFFLNPAFLCQDYSQLTRDILAGSRGRAFMARLGLVELGCTLGPIIVIYINRQVLQLTKGLGEAGYMLVKSQFQVGFLP